VATGYSNALTASDIAGQLAGCQGSSMFNVVAGAITPVAVHLICHETPTGPPPPPPAVPIPPAVPAVLALALLALGARALRNRRT
jgi:hypothetical protein